MTEVKTVMKEIKRLSSLLHRRRTALEKAGEAKKATYEAARHIQHLERDRRAVQGQLPLFRLHQGGKDGLL